MTPAERPPRVYGPRKKAPRKKTPRNGIRRPMLMLTNAETQEVMENNYLISVIRTNQKNHTAVLIVKDFDERRHQRVSWETFFELLESKGLAVFKAQDSDYLKIMNQKKSYRAALIVGAGAKKYGIQA